VRQAWNDEEEDGSTHSAPLLELCPVDRTDPHAAIDAAVNDPTDDVHADAHKLEVDSLLHAVLGGELEALDAAELADVLRESLQRVRELQHETEQNREGGDSRRRACP